MREFISNNIFKITIVIISILILLIGAVLIRAVQDKNQEDYTIFCNNVNIVQQKIIEIYDQNSEYVGVKFANTFDKEEYVKSIKGIKEIYGVDLLSDDYYYINTEYLRQMGINEIKNEQYVVNYETSEVYNLNPIIYNWGKVYTSVEIDSTLKGVAKYNIPPIPKGFKHVKGNWDNGFVIKDNLDNEFVWVPVGYLNENNPENELKKYYKKYISGSVETEEYTSILNSLKKYQGFYIGRYEASLKGATEKSSKGISNVLQVVKNIMPISNMSFTTKYDYAIDPNTGYKIKFIGYDENGNISNESTSRGALEMARNMAYDYNWDESGIRTSLMYSEQYDTLLKIIENKKLLNDRKNENKNPITEDAILWGNYMNSSFNYKLGNDIVPKNSNESILLPTGVDIYDGDKLYERNSVFNIYDLAGNLSEWTMNSELKQMCVRGGNYSLRSTFSIPVEYEKQSPNEARSTIGIRIVMYLD